MNIETTLRESLHAHSAEAPTNACLLGVRSRSGPAAGGSAGRSWARGSRQRA
jgi:hypothetical protein